MLNKHKLILNILDKHMYGKANTNFANNTAVKLKFSHKISNTIYKYKEIGNGSD